MEVIGRLITESKKLAAQEEDLKAEVSQLNSELIVEELNLNKANQDYENLRNQVENAQQTFDNATKQKKFLETMRETLKSSISLSSILKKYIENANPTGAQQMEKIKDLESFYEQCIRIYQQNPAYQAIVAEEATERELKKLIAEKQNEIMRLETQREF